MPILIIEDGTGIADANSYIDITTADSYFEQFGLDLINLSSGDTWADLTDDTKTIALANACESLDVLYGEKFRGELLTDTQALSFPRTPFYDGRGRQVTGLPPAVPKAQCEIALLYLTGVDVFPGVNAEKFVKSKTESVDVFTDSVEYAGRREVETFPGFRKVELLLAPYLIQDTRQWRLSL